MRIQHNIMAMNAYRNYTNNVSAMKKNLERLSSGYKINRAGDDAAGLAISEKMRAQITGLETAQKNAKDGISLVQTAEGALTEVHDMLNRMVELATQSANGTYEGATDRAQLQKELDQLREEIDRIADSANFNGISLLDGSLDQGGRSVDAAVNILPNDYKLIDPEYPQALVGDSTILKKDGANSQQTKFSVQFDTLSINVGANGGTLTVGIGKDDTFDLELKEGTYDAQALASALNDYFATNDCEINGATWSVTYDGGTTVTFEQTAGEAAVDGNMSVGMVYTPNDEDGKPIDDNAMVINSIKTAAEIKGSANDSISVGGGEGDYAVYESVLTLTGIENLNKATDSVNIGGTVYALSDISENTLDAKTIADFIASKLSTSDWTVTANDDGSKLVYTANTVGAVGGDAPAAPTAPASIKFVSGASNATSAKYVMDIAYTAGTLSKNDAVVINGTTFALSAIEGDLTQKSLADFIASKLSESGYDITANEDGTQLIYDATSAGLAGGSNGGPSSKITATNQPTISFQELDSSAAKQKSEFKINGSFTNTGLTAGCFIDIDGKKVELSEEDIADTESILKKIASVLSEGGDYNVTVNANKDGLVFEAKYAGAVNGSNAGDGTQAPKAAPAAPTITFYDSDGSSQTDTGSAALAFNGSAEAGEVTGSGSTWKAHTGSVTFTATLNSGSSSDGADAVDGTDVSNATAAAAAVSVSSQGADATAATITADATGLDTDAIQAAAEAIGAGSGKVTIEYDSDSQYLTLKVNGEVIGTSNEKVDGTNTSFTFETGSGDSLGTVEFSAAVSATDLTAALDTGLTYDSGEKKLEVTSTSLSDTYQVDYADETKSFEDLFPGSGSTELNKLTTALAAVTKLADGDIDVDFTAIVGEWDENTKLSKILDDISSTISAAVDAWNAANTDAEYKYEYKGLSTDGTNADLRTAAATGLYALIERVSNSPDENNGTVSGSYNSGTVNITQGTAEGADQRASTVIDLNEIFGGDIGSGSELTIAGTTYKFVRGDSFGVAGNTITLDKNATAEERIKQAAEGLSRMTNDCFSIGNRSTIEDEEAGTKNYGKISIDELETHDTKYNSLLTTHDGFASLFSAKSATAKDETKGLKLQIGDTAEKYNQLVVSINDCHTKALGLANINIETQDGAANAIAAIKDAINYVSDVRGTLGATQNRLDHTINNLSVMTENIQDAESTIRDTDIAEEMMAYTKNNILIQSAQAMLAQANQVPQGVLQLLQ